MPPDWRRCLKVGGLTLAGMFAIAGGLSLVDESQDTVIEAISIPIHVCIQRWMVLHRPDH
jgi:hypothetical protein